MTKQTPNFLRLHTEDTASDVAASASADVLIAQMCQSFSEATDWQLRVCDVSAGTEPNVVWVHELPAERGQPRRALSMVRGKGKSGQSRPSLPAITLAEQIAGLIDNLYETRRALWRCEGELAAGVALVEHADEAHHLAARLMGVLQGVTEAVEAKAAALYLLDDATTQLKLRSCWNLPNDRFVTAGRPLAAAVADLEALAGSAVVIEDVKLLPHWRVPEDFAAAACVPVSSPTTPLGTLWVFDDTARDFLTSQTNMMEICAGRIASDLERELLLTRVSFLNQVEKQTATVRTVWDQQLPTTKVASAAWDVSARCLRGRRGGGGFYDWMTLADGRLLLCLGDAEQQGLPATFTAAKVQAAVRALSASERQPGRLIAAVDRMLQTTSTGGQFASLWLAAFDEFGTSFSSCSAGSIGVIQIGGNAANSLSQGARACGYDGEATFATFDSPITSGEAICVVSDQVRRAQDADGEPLGEAAIADAARAAAGGTASEILDAITSALFAHSGPTLAADCTILVAKAL